MPSIPRRQTLATLRQAALMFSHEIYDSTAAIPDHWGNTLDIQLNEGVRQMWMGSKGIQADGVIQAIAGQQQYPLPAEFLYMEKLVCNGKPLDPVGWHELCLGSTTTGCPQGYAIRKGSTPSTGGLVPFLWLAPYPPQAAYTLAFFYRRSSREMVDDEDCPELPLQWQLSPAYWAAFNLAIADANPASQGLAQIFHKMQQEMLFWLQSQSLDCHPVTGTHGSGWDSQGGY